MIENITHFFAGKIIESEIEEITEQEIEDATRN
jgi:hypothetical protein